MTALSFFDHPDELSAWLLRAAALYGDTLEPVAETGATVDRTELGRDELQGRRARALSPVVYDIDFSFTDHVLRAAGRREAAARPEAAQMGGGPLRWVLDESIELALRRWKGGDGAPALYLLLSLAARKRCDRALATVRDLFARGRASLLPEPWKHAIGYQITVLAYTFAQTIDGRELLSDLPTRSDYWTPTCSGMVCSGMVFNHPDQWLSITERFIDDLERLDPLVLRVQCRSVVNSATLPEVLVGTCTQLPVFYGFDRMDLPMPGEPTVRVLKAFFAHDIAPIEFHYWGRLSFACGDASMALRDATRSETVIRAFAQIAQERRMNPVDPDYVYYACAERFTELVGRSLNTSPPGLDPFASAVSDREIRDDVEDDLRRPEPLDEIMAGVDEALQGSLWGSIGAALDALEVNLERLGRTGLA